MSSGLAEMWDTLSSLQTLESTPIPAQMFQLSKALSNIQMCSPLLHPKLYFHTKVLQLSPVFVLLSWPEFIRKFTTLFPHLLLTLLPHLNYQEALTSPRPLTIYMLLSMHFFQLLFDLISQPLLHCESWPHFSNLLFLWEPHCHLSWFLSSSLIIYPVDLRCPWNFTPPLNVLMILSWVLPYHSGHSLRGSSLTLKTLYWYECEFQTLASFPALCCVLWPHMVSLPVVHLPHQEQQILSKRQPRWLLLPRFSYQAF